MLNIPCVVICNGINGNIRCVCSPNELYLRLRFSLSFISLRMSTCTLFLITGPDTLKDTLFNNKYP